MQLVMLKDKSPITNSLIIGDVFGKDHKDVLRAIRNLIKDVSDSQAQEHQRKIALMYQPNFGLIPLRKLAVQNSQGDSHGN